MNTLDNFVLSGSHIQQRECNIMLVSAHLYYFDTRFQRTFSSAFSIDLLEINLCNPVYVLNSKKIG